MIAKRQSACRPGSRGRGPGESPGAAARSRGRQGWTPPRHFAPTCFRYMLSRLRSRGGPVCYSGSRRVHFRQEVSMKRFLVLFLVMGVLVVAGRSVPVVAQDDKKDEKKVDKDKKEADKDKKEEKKDKDAKDKDEKDKGKKPEDKPLTEEQKKELEKLSGTFEVTVFERDGKKAPPEDLKKMKVVQKGAEWTFYLGDDPTQGKDTVHPDKTPRQIDSLYLNGPAKDQTVQG